MEEIVGEKEIVTVIVRYEAVVGCSVLGTIDLTTVFLRGLFLLQQFHMAMKGLE